METFADVLHGLIDTVFHGELAEKAHGIIDRASGTRTSAPAPAGDTAGEAAAPDVPEPRNVPDEI